MDRKDPILIGTVAGMLAALIKDIPNYIFFRFGVIHVTYWTLAASAFIRASDLDRPTALIIGAFTDIIMGGILGVLIWAVFKLFGRDLWGYKGLVVGNTVWLFGAGLAVNVFARLAPVEPAFRLTSLLDHQLFGLAAAFLIWRWTKLVTPR